MNTSTKTDQERADRLTPDPSGKITLVPIGGLGERLRADASTMGHIRSEALSIYSSPTIITT